MSQNAFDNSGLKDKLHLEGTPVASFTPAVNLAITSGDLVVTDASTYPATDGLKKAHVRVIDFLGKELKDTITTTGAPGAKTIDLATINTSKPLVVCVTVLTNNGLKADGRGEIFAVTGGAGAVANWDKQ
jgi:hypothetical protein